MQDTDDTSLSVRRKLLDENVEEKDEIDIEDASFKMELKIVEDDDKKVQIESEEVNKIDTPDQHVAKIEEEIETVKKLIIETQLETTHVIHNESKVDEDVPIDNQKDKINGIIEEQNNETIDISESSADDLFKKVDIVTYKKQQSDENHLEVYENEPETSPEIQTTVSINNNIDKVNRKTSTDWEMSEFSEFDKVIKEIENTAIAFIDEDDIKPEETKGNRVSQLKFQFETVDTKDDNSYEIRSNSPNPIPKPRRAKLFSKSVSSDSSKAASSSSPNM